MKIASHRQPWGRPWGIPPNLYHWRKPMNNDEPTMTNDELIAAFAQLNDPAWRATLPEPPSCREKQYRRYREAMALKWHGTAMDAVWRAASEADLLTQDEYRDNDLPPNRMAELLTRLGWE